jgi:hypothetical protein
MKLMGNPLIKLNVRLACVKHLDSVHSEPSSNSQNFFLMVIYTITNVFILSYKSYNDLYIKKIDIKYYNLYFKNYF